MEFDHRGTADGVEDVVVQGHGVSVGIRLRGRVWARRALRWVSAGTGRAQRRGAEPVQAGGQPGDLAQDQQGWRTHRVLLRGGGQAGERAGDHALLRARAVFHQRERSGRRATCLQQALLDALQAGHAHVEGQGLAFLAKRLPVQCVERILAVRGDQPQRLGMVAMGERNAGVGGAGDRGGDAGMT